MDRLQKKCLIITLAMHGLLVLVLLFGAALMPTPKDDNVHLLQMVDISTITDGPTKGGEPVPAVAVAPPANPNPPQQTPQAAPPPPAPAEPKHVDPPPTKVKEPDVVKTEKPIEPKVIHRNVHSEIPRLKPAKHEPKDRLTPDELTLATPTHKTKTTHHPAIEPDSLKPVKRHVDEKAKAEHEAQIEAEKAAERAERNRQRQLAKLFSGTLRNLGHGLSTATLVQTSPGFGGGGQASVNYRDLIASKYYNAWNPPAYLDQEVPVVTATVTIGSDGNVISARIVKGSGNSMMDKSIQNVLDIVTFFEPFPAGSTDRQRTFTIHFNLQAKRQIG